MIMCKAMEELADKWADEKILEVKKQTALALIGKGKLSLEDIAECANLPLGVVQELAALQPA